MSTYEKAEGLVAVVIVVAFVMVGLSFMPLSPTYHTETRSATAALVPNALPPVIPYPSWDMWNKTGCANKWDCVDTQDGNTSYVYCVPTNQTVCSAQYFNLTNLPADANGVSSVSMFSWTKRNATSDLIYGFWLARSNLAIYPECTWDDTTTTGTLKFTNYTSTPITECRGHGQPVIPWSVALVNNNLTIAFTIGSGTPDSVPWVTTYLGVVVTYTHNVLVLDASYSMSLLLPVVLVAVAVIFTVAIGLRVGRSRE